MLLHHRVLSQATTPSLVPPCGCILSRRVTEKVRSTTRAARIIRRAPAELTCVTLITTGHVSSLHVFQIRRPPRQTNVWAGDSRNEKLNEKIRLLARHLAFSAFLRSAPSVFEAHQHGTYAQAYVSPTYIRHACTLNHPACIVGVMRIDVRIQRLWGRRLSRLAG